MFDILFKSVTELDKTASKNSNSYEQFQKTYKKYTDDAKKSGMIKSPTSEELFGLPYKGK